MSSPIEEPIPEAGIRAEPVDGRLEGPAVRSGRREALGRVVS